jgi:hypothetical protein
MAKVDGRNINPSGPVEKLKARPAPQAAYLTTQLLPPTMYSMSEEFRLITEGVLPFNFCFIWFQF